MKKILIIPILIISILSYNKVKASSGIANSGYINNYYGQGGTSLSASNYFGDGQMIYIVEGQTNIWFNNNHNHTSGFNMTHTKPFSEIIFQVAINKPSQVNDQSINDSIAVTAQYGQNGNLYSYQICQFTGEVELGYNQSDYTYSNEPNYLVYYNLICPIPVYTNSNIYISRLAIQAKTTSSLQQFHINRNITMMLNDNYILQEQQQGTTNAINQQTQQEQQQHNEIMNANQTYTDETNTDINGANETIEYEQAENQLIQSIDVNESLFDGISINPLASAYIWNLANGIRQMNPAIITLMSAILGLGIVKLILNR